MNNWKKALIKPGQTVREAIEIIDKAAAQIALVVDGDLRLLGTVTDGDIRRSILQGKTLQDDVASIMMKNPTTMHMDDSPESIRIVMVNKAIRQVPLVDDAGILTGLKLQDEMFGARKLENIAVIMAGGLGSRLHELTKDTPKPLLYVGGRPILETILGNLIESGFQRFYLSVNYKAEMLMNYFGDGSRWGVEICYLREQKRMGTAGALSLLPERPSAPILVMNSDLLTKLNFPQLLDFHMKHDVQATMCIREYDFQVPYGVVKIDHHRLIGIEEKPVVKFFVNAGIYVIQPESLDDIPRDSFYDMPDLFDRLIKEGKGASVFPIREYWLDIGRMDDLERANGDFFREFK